MSTVQQSGNVTPGHGTKWITDGVVGDAGANPYSQRVLASFLNVDFNTVTDQGITLPSTLNYFQLTGIIVTNVSVSLNTATGGFYTDVFKGGSQIVAAAQVYSALTTDLLLMQPTLTAYALAQRFSRTQLPNWMIYLSLSIAQGSPATADVYLLGVELG